MKIYVIGTGTMAKGIVKAFAAKMPVVMKSRTQASLDKAMASIEKGYMKLVEKGKMTEEAVKAIGKKQQAKEGNAYMLVEGKEQELKDYLNAHLDRETPTKAIALLYAAKELGYTSKLKFAEAEELFGTFAKQSTFTAYYNGRRSFDKTILQSYKTALINKFGAI